MKLNSISDLSFQKTLVAKTKFKKNTNDNKTKVCKIYVLDSPQDIDYINNLKTKKNWKNSMFLNMLSYDFHTCLNPFNYLNTYVMEVGKDSECVACAQTFSFNKIIDVRLLETAPAYRNNPKNKHKPKIDHIGETFLAFFAKQAKLYNAPTSRIELTSVPTAVSFYEKKCGFLPVSSHEIEFYLPQVRYDAFIKQNKKHTGGNINFDV